MAERPTVPPPSQEVAGEDFLFHLYRGSELLQDGRVHEAKSELETALTHSPSDAKSQHLLGVVYFRLGLYPRAIAIYERLVRSHPTAIEPRVNLALSYLKTGQPALARSELERVVDLAPSHTRAWGYLGLAFQRLGDSVRAREAYGRGGHDHMARRLTDPAQAMPAYTIPPDAPSVVATELQPATGDDAADSEAPAGGLRAAPADDRRPTAVSGSWTAVDLGLEPLPSLPSLGASFHAGRASSSPPAPAASSPPPRPTVPPGLPPPPDLGPASGSPTTRRPLDVTAPTPAAELLRDRLIVFPRDLPVCRHATGVVIVQAQERFAARLGLVRALALAPDATVTPLERRARGRTLGEPLGGPLAPLFEIAGRSEVVLSPPVGRSLRPVTLSEARPLHVREDLVAGFEPGVAYENARLALGDGDSASMVLLRGTGTVVLALPESAATIEVTEARPLIARGASILGWLGRVIPHALTAAEAPSSARGYVSLAGDGMVLLDVD